MCYTNLLLYLNFAITSLMRQKSHTEAITYHRIHSKARDGKWDGFYQLKGRRDNHGAGKVAAGLGHPPLETLYGGVGAAL
jgi:hypothetical protein